MSLFTLIRTSVLLTVEAAGACALCTFVLYPALDAHRAAGMPLIPPLLYVLTWLVICAIATCLIVTNIHAYIHPEQESEA